LAIREAEDSERAQNRNVLGTANGNAFYSTEQAVESPPLLMKIAVRPRQF
jgi:hypothetical protein